MRYTVRAGVHLSRQCVQFLTASGVRPSWRYAAMSRIFGASHGAVDAGYARLFLNLPQSLMEVSGEVVRIHPVVTQYAECPGPVGRAIVGYAFGTIVCGPASLRTARLSRALDASNRGSVFSVIGHRSISRLKMPNSARRSCLCAPASLLCMAFTQHIDIDVSMAVALQAEKPATSRLHAERRTRQTVHVDPMS